jgi:hypothetical protein
LIERERYHPSPYPLPQGEGAGKLDSPLSLADFSKGSEKQK